MIHSQFSSFKIAYNSCIECHIVTSCNEKFIKISCLNVDVTFVLKNANLAIMSIHYNLLKPSSNFTYDQD
jgi:hypothetical protein